MTVSFAGTDLGNIAALVTAIAKASRSPFTNSVGSNSHGAFLWPPANIGFDERSFSEVSASLQDRSPCKDAFHLLPTEAAVMYVSSLLVHTRHPAHAKPLFGPCVM